MATVNKEGGSELIKLGDHEVWVVPQRHARIRRRLSADDFRKIMSGDYAAEAYRILGILIPDLTEKVPLYEWEGFASEEAYAKGDEGYDEDKDRSPTTLQIVEAFETALRVSGVTKLGKIIDLVQLGVQAQGMTDSTPTPSSPESPGSNGGSASTSTGAPSPT